MGNVRQKLRLWAAKQIRSALGADFLRVIAQRQEAASGENVTTETAMKVAAVYACVRVLSETIASLPLFLYQSRADNGKDVLRKNPLFDLLHDRPNAEQTAYEFWETAMAHMNLRGNFFAQKIRTNAGKLAELIPLDPSLMVVERDENSRKLIYKYTDSHGQEARFDSETCWHLRGLSLDGVVGMSPITQMREAIGLAMAADKYGARFFKNDARPGGYVSHPTKLSQVARDNIKESLQAAIGGENIHSIAVFEEGMEYKTIGLSNEDAQFLESRQFQIEEIARAYRVPCVLIGHPDSTSTYASAEQFFLSFVVHTIRPWLVRIEKSINVNLLSEQDRKRGIFAEFKVDGLLRGDTAARYAAYSIAITNRIMNPNECRALENMNPYDGGEKYENPNTAPQKPSEPEPDVEEIEDEEPTE